MLYIDITRTKIIDAHSDHVSELKGLIKKKATSTATVAITNFLTDKRIELILGATPKNLLTLNTFFFRQTFPGFTQNDLGEYIAINKTRSFTPREIALKTVFDPFFEEIIKIFDYEQFSTKRKRKYDAYDLAEALDIPTCPYCNRMYTKTVKKANHEKIARPSFDHWYPKSKYPLLALSFYNLIPSCSVCNSGVKGSTPFTLNTHFHPYYVSPDSTFDYKFSYVHKGLRKYEFKIKTSDPFSERSLKAFELEAIFKAHEDEILDLVKIKEAYSHRYIEILENNILKKVSVSKSEIYRLAFGVYFDEKDFDRRPLSKMKKDLLTELGIVKD